MKHPPSTLPRKDLRLPAFRRYESYIACGLIAPTTINPHTTENLAPSTFIARFRDAILARKKFNYPSEYIPSNVSLETLTIDELPGGLVLIQNKTDDKPNVQMPEDPYSETKIIAIMQRVATKEIPHHNLQAPTIDIYNSIIQIVNNHEEIDCVVAGGEKLRLHFYTL